MDFPAPVAKPSLLATCGWVSQSISIRISAATLRCRPTAKEAFRWQRRPARQKSKSKDIQRPQQLLCSMAPQAMGSGRFFGASRRHRNSLVMHRVTSPSQSPRSQALAGPFQHHRHARVWHRHWHHSASGVAAAFAQSTVPPNRSLKRSAIGRAPGPRGRHVYHQPRGPGTLPPSAA